MRCLLDRGVQLKPVSSNTANNVRGNFGSPYGMAKMIIRGIKMCHFFGGI